MRDLIELRKQVNKRLAEWNVARATYKIEKEALKKANERFETVQKAQIIAQETAQQVQQQAHLQITGIVNRSLQTIFDEPYTFKIEFEQKRGRTEAALIFERGEMKLDPLTSSGGGVIDVAAFALRLSCLLLTRPQARKVLILDEPFKNLSANYRPRLQSLIETLSKELGIQIIMSTNIESLEMGKVVDLQPHV